MRNLQVIPHYDLLRMNQKQNISMRIGIESGGGATKPILDYISSFGSALTPDPG